LGEVEERLGNSKKSYSYFKQAHKLSPNNPKYLDFLIEASIDVNDKLAALDALQKLKEVNPGNKKIPIFEKHIADINMLVDPPVKKTRRSKTK
jgi:tetratricopeptide (TPR) repeat protein